MSQDNPGVLHDATNSWNGYNHQGKIALYYAVKKIKALLEAAADRAAGLAALQTHFLEVEYTEDFSIGTIGANGELCYQTIHQVKDRKDTALSKYTSAIQGLAVNMVRHPEVEAAYLHVTRCLSTVPRDKPFAESVEEMIQKTDWIDDQESKAQKEADEAKKQADLAWLKEVRTKLPLIWQDQEQLEKIRKYPYEMPGGESRDYCPEDEARDYVCRSLREFYGMHDPDRDYKQGDEFISRSYQYSLEKLNEHVVYRSKHYSDKNVRRQLTLWELYQWLVSPEIEQMGEDYYLYHIKEGYFGYLDEFCAGCGRERCRTCRVSTFKGRFRCMKPQELRDFVHLTNPNVPGAIAIEQYHKYLQRNGIRDPFWSGLRRITQEPQDLQQGNVVQYLGTDNRTYILTTLMTDQSTEEDDDDEFAQKEKEKEEKTICTEIYRNQNESELDLSGKCLLSRNIEVESVQERALTINPSDICGDKNNIIASRRISILKVKDFRKRYMREAHEES